MDRVRMKQGDLNPKITATLQMGNPLQAVDLTGCTVKLRYAMPYMGALFVFEKDVEILTPEDEGNVSYQWVAGDTDIAGTYEAEWVVALPDEALGTLTVPNNFNFLLEFVPRVGNLTFALTHGGNQSQLLVRRLRVRLADADRDLYDDDSKLAQGYVDSFESFLAEADVTTTLFELDDPDYDEENPLATVATLTRREQDLWMLVTARELLEAEILEASRIAATLRTPAGQHNMTEVYKALRAALADVESALDRKLAEDSVKLVFVDLAVGDTARFTDDAG